MKQCEHPLKGRVYGSVLMGFIHREVELCTECEHFRLLDNPLRGWLVLKEKSMFEAQELQAEGNRRLRGLLAWPGGMTARDKSSLTMRPGGFGLEQSTPDPEYWSFMTRMPLAGQLPIRSEP